MGSISVFVTDIINGQSAEGMELVFSRVHFSQVSILKTCYLNSKGGTNNPLLSGRDFSCGEYRLTVNAKSFLEETQNKLGISPVPFLIYQTSSDFCILNKEIDYEIRLLVGFSSFSFVLSSS